MPNLQQKPTILADIQGSVTHTQEDKWVTETTFDKTQILYSSARDFKGAILNSLIKINAILSLRTV
jgi:hypothetical protein